VQVVDPKTAQSFEIKSLNEVLQRFPVFKNYVDYQTVDNEWRKHAMLDFRSLELDNNNDPEIYWRKVFSLKNDANELIFPNLKKVFSLLLVLPFSNASVERIFSNVFNIKTDKRNLLNTDTLRSILATKDGIAKSGGCLNFTPTKKMLNFNHK